MTITNHHLLDPQTRPPAIRYRDDEQARLRTALEPPTDHVHISGPHGTGKTLLAQNILTAFPGNTSYLSCTAANTQYKVLTRLYTQLTDDTINPGYHTAQLQSRLIDRLQNTRTAIVLDDLDFLLQHDGNDLLYVLSRLDHHTDLCLIELTTARSALRTNLDDRTYSSLRPREVTLTPYTPDEAAQLLRDRAEPALPAETVESTALEYLTETTTNLTLGLHWLAYAATRAATIDVNVIKAVKPAAQHRYRTALLTPFTQHHTLLLDAIDQEPADDPTATTGTVYDRYTTRCTDAGLDPLTLRRINDYLTHLELLGLIDITRHYGGEMGKTQEIRPTPLQEL